MHFPVGFKNIDDNPFPVDKEKKRAVFDEIDYVITYNEMENLVDCSGQQRLRLQASRKSGEADNVFESTL